MKIFTSWHDMLCTLLHHATYTIRMNPEEFATCILRVNCSTMKMVAAGSSTTQQHVVSQHTVIYTHITMRTSSYLKVSGDSATFRISP